MSEIKDGESKPMCGCRYLSEIRNIMRSRLVSGNYYRIRERVPQERDERKRDTVLTEMRLVQMYPHFALFETKQGVRNCFLYQDIRKLLA